MKTRKALRAIVLTVLVLFLAAWAPWSGTSGPVAASSIAAGTNGQVLMTIGGASVYQTLTGDVTVSATGATTLNTASVALGGVSGSNAFAWCSNTVALTSGAANTLTNAQYNCPYLHFTGTLSGAGTTVVFPTTNGACWLPDFTSVTFGANTLGLVANSVTWATTISSTATTETPFVCYRTNPGKLVGTTLTQ